jgi:PAS domain S-box-containing protein
MNASSRVVSPGTPIELDGSFGRPLSQDDTETQVGGWEWDFAVGAFSLDPRWCEAQQLDACVGPDHLERWARRIHPDDVAEFRRKYESVRTGQVERFDLEYRVLIGESRWLWLLQRGRIAERGADGAVVRATGICLEIDDRKRAEVALQENEARLATALWGARAAFWQWHVATDMAVMSPLWFAMTGYTREQWESIPNPWMSRIHADDRSAVQLQIRRHLSGQSTSIEIEYRIRAANGDWKWMLTRGRAVEWDFEGKATSAIGVSLDIDAQKRAERELQSSETRLETAVWGAGMGLWETDFRTENTRWYSDWCDRLDLHACEGQDHVERWDANIHPEDVNSAARRFGDHVAGKADYYDAEYRIRDKKGRWRWLFERGRVVERDAAGGALRMVGVCMDIEERKEAELEYIRSQRRLEVALESARGGMWDWDLLGSGQARHTEFYYRLLGVDPREGERSKNFWNSRVHPEDLPRVLAAAQEVIEGRKELYEAEYRLRHQNGSWRWVLDRGRVPERNADGRATRMVGFLVDVTDRVQTQEALRQSEFRYRTVASMAPGYVFEYRYNAEGCPIPIWASDGMQAIFGCTLETQQGGWDELVDDEWKPIVAARHARILRGEPQAGETRIHTVTGERKWLYVSTLPVRDPQTGSVTGVLGSAYDITTRKLAEQAVRESEAVLRAVTENTPDWLFLVDESLHVRFMNRQFGVYRSEDVMGCSLLQFIPEPHRDRLEALYRGVLATGEPARFELRHPNSNNTMSHHEHRVVPVIDSGVVRSLTVAVTDVTERNRAESALRESQMTLQTVAASSADWLALFDRQRQCVFLNRAMRGVPPEGWVGAPVEDFAPPADRAYMHEIFEHVMNTGEPRDFDQVIIDPKRGPRYLELRARAVQADGRIFGAVVNITEVTERHSQQDTLRTQARILETMREGVVLIDTTTHLITLTNATFDKMFGYGALELLGRSIDPLFSMPALQRKRFERTLRDGSEAVEVMPEEFECSRRDGSRFVATCVITPLRISGTERWLAVLNDVTERKRLEREIIEISNREQQRIGSDLHDGLGQDLTGIALMLKGVATQLRKEGSAARMDVEDVIGLVNNAIESTRTLARGLSPVSGERGGLSAALQTLAARASERYGMRVEFNASFEEPLRLNETSATHVYRIVQEALTNVIRHSRATDVTISLETASGELHLRIDDNGRGFEQPPPDAASGLGLKIMRYRAQMLGGDLVLESGTNGGASVRCSCPLDGSAVTDPAKADRDVPARSGLPPH